jgi:hypothetical protein
LQAALKGANKLSNGTDYRTSIGGMQQFLCNEFLPGYRARTTGVVDTCAGPETNGSPRSQKSPSKRPSKKTTLTHASKRHASTRRKKSTLELFCQIVSKSFATLPVCIYCHLVQAIWTRELRKDAVATSVELL